MRMRITVLCLHSCSCSLLLVGAFLSLCSDAMDANPEPFFWQQPDGTEVEIFLRGEEMEHYLTDVDGYTVLEITSAEQSKNRTAVRTLGGGGNKQQRTLVYATLDSSTGRLKPTKAKVGGKRPRGLLEKHLRPSMQAFQQDCRRKQHFCGETTIKNSKRTLSSLRETETNNYHGTEPPVEPTTPPSPTQRLHQLRQLLLDTSGRVKNLVIPIRFQDHHDRILPTKEELSVLMNHAGPHPKLCPTGSVRDVFKFNSYGALDLESVVLDWVDVEGTEAYWANGYSGLTIKTRGLISQVLSKVDEYIDFKDFDLNNDKAIDAISFFHSGYAAEWGDNGFEDRIWSHHWHLDSDIFESEEGVKVKEYHINPALWKTDGSQIGRIGVVAHETAHFLGLPDMYDYDSESNGLGNWDLLANSWGFGTRDDRQLYPPHMSAYTKLFLGWDTAVTIETSGAYSIGAAQNSAGHIKKITQGFPKGEYLLIENRQKVLFDVKMPGPGGLVIYHVDENSRHDYSAGYPGQTGWPANGKHYKVAVLPRDRRYDLERGSNRGDAADTWFNTVAGLTPSRDPSNPELGPFPNTDSYQGGLIAQTGISITHISASGSVMTFRVSLPTISTVAPTESPTAAKQFSLQSSSDGMFPMISKQARNKNGAPGVYCVEMQRARKANGIPALLSPCKNPVAMHQSFRFAPISIVGSGSSAVQYYHIVAAHSEKCLFIRGVNKDATGQSIGQMGCQSPRIIHQQWKILSAPTAKYDDSADFVLVQNRKSVFAYRYKALRVARYLIGPVGLCWFYYSDQKA